MEQTKALNALEPFLALTKTATAPRAAADLITQATSNPSTYVFTELLQTPQIQKLSQSPDHASYLKLLEIFSYGTYENYTSATNLPPLNDAQALKLRQLSLLTLAKDPLNLSYAALQQSLSLPDARAVENLVISAIYAGLVDAQLDPRNRTIHIFSVSPLRDLAPGSITPILNTLRAWSGRCASTLEELEAQIAEIKANAAQRHNEKKAWADQQAKLILDESEATKHNSFTQPQGSALNRTFARMQGQRFGKRGNESLDGSADGDEFMDIDDDDVEDADGGSGVGGAALGGPGKKRASRRKL